MHFNRLHALPCTCIFLLSSLFVSSNANGDLVYESATLGAPFGGGTSVAVTGSWFSITERTRITALGGHLSISNAAGTPDSVWASIVELPRGVLPANDFDIEANSLVSGLITTVSHGDSSDRRVNVDTILNPGDYAILIGGRGLFGTNSSAIMPENGTDFPGASYFSQYFDSGAGDFAWDDGTLIDRSGTRLVVEGTAVPEPNSCLLVGTAILVFASRRRRLLLKAR